MDNNFDDLGRKIQNMVDDAIKSQNYQSLSREITDTITNAVNSGTEYIKKATGASRQQQQADYRRYRYQVPEEFQHRNRQQARQVKNNTGNTMPVLYKNLESDKGIAIALIVVGALFAAGNGFSLFLRSVIRSVLYLDSGLSFGSTMALIMMLAGIGLVGYGVGKLGKIRRFKNYVKALKDRTYIELKQLASLTGKKVSYVKKDLRSMLDKGWFLQGHLEEEQLITSEETFRQYEIAQQQMKARQQEEQVRQEEQKQREQKESQTDPRVKDILQKGKAYLDEIHASNARIPGEEISRKISRMEEIVAKIFDRARNHPEVAPDLSKLMNYYLPMTIKLLHAYEEMEQQPVQGDNIRAARKEIEETLDTLNQAFEKLLDSVFADTALDISTDISVLETLLAQEGLANDDF